MLLVLAGFELAVYTFEALTRGVEVHTDTGADGTGGAGGGGDGVGGGGDGGGDSASGDEVSAHW